MNHRPLNALIRPSRLGAVFLFASVNLLIAQRPASPALPQLSPDQIIERANTVDMNQDYRQIAANVLETFRAKAPSDGSWGDLTNQPSVLIPQLTLMLMEGDSAGPAAQSHRCNAAALWKNGASLIEFTPEQTYCIEAQAASVSTHVLRTRLGDAATQVKQDESELLKQAIEGTVTAYCIAHEIAHHRLHHVHGTSLRTNPSIISDDAQLQRKRARELEADTVAFAMLNESDFSLPILGHYFDYLANLERMRIEYLSFKTPERLSDHPRWSTRALGLKDYMGRYAPVDPTAVFFSSFTPDGKNGVEKISLMYLTDPSSRTGGIYRHGQWTLIGIRRNADGSINFYNRAADQVITLADYRGYETTGSRASLYQPNRAESLPYGFFRDSILGIAVFGDPQLLAFFSSLDVSKSLDRIVQSLPASKRELSLRLLRALTAETQEITLRYHQGLISLDDLQKLSMAAERGYDAKFDSQVGLGTSQAIRNAKLQVDLELLQKVAAPRYSGGQLQLFSPAGQHFALMLPGVPRETTALPDRLEDPRSHEFSLETPDTMYVIRIQNLHSLGIDGTGQLLTEQGLNAMTDSMVTNGFIPLEHRLFEYGGIKGQRFSMEFAKQKDMLMDGVAFLTPDTVVLVGAMHARNKLEEVNSVLASLRQAP